ncbi:MULTISPECIES: hypothetical protein [Halorussus]|uniref:hypothetical protein n=1 Tax=Halorussus TaxID=1070314 RepID=UPI00209DD688|nr:hypothetical protein [Halorussus vallis]USZ78149.1 hypothetical protein NGM07_21055 [Halorussus vallis]
MRTLPVLLVAGVALLGATTLVVADSPYDSNVVSERPPFAPERPATLDRTTAAAYIVDYERMRLRNDMLSARGHTLDRRDEVRATCTSTSVAPTEAGGFRVQLRCRGDVNDAYRLFEPGGFSYVVTYRVAENATEQLRIRGYPYRHRDELRRQPSSW